MATPRLVDALWDDEPPSSWRQSLHFLVHRLRQCLGEGRDAMITREPGYLVQVEPGQLDVTRFEELVAKGRAAWAAGDAREASGALKLALGLWHGPALADFEGMRFAQAEIPAWRSPA